VSHLHEGLRMRACPFCAAAERTAFGTRHGTPFVRCGRCASIFADLTPDEFAVRHGGVYCDTAFATDIIDALGDQPDHSTWAEIAPLFEGKTFLEIGPGSGSLVAAAQDAGWQVTALETSEANRDFIRTRRGIERVYDSFDAFPAR